MKYDIIVLGAGSAGLNVSMFSARLGLKVLTIEKHLVGGDCLNFGCVPSKALISLAHLAHSANEAKKLGLNIEGNINLKTVAETIKARQDSIREHENPEYLRKKGMDVEIGEPKFTGKNSIIINGKEHTAKKIVIATGSRPLIPPFKGLENVKYMTNETIFENSELPKNLLIIGGGPIGTEIAQAYQRLGAQVTVVARDPQFLPREEHDMAEELLTILKREGVNVRLGWNPEEFTSPNILQIKQWDTNKNESFGEAEEIHFDQVLIATGRKINIDNLDIEKAGVKLDSRKRPIVDDKMRTTNRKILIAGDVAGSFQFTHWAEYQAGIIMNNLLSPIKKKVNNKKIAWVTYTDPELATFGMQKSELDKKKTAYTIIEQKIANVDRAISEGNSDGKLKLYVHKGKILGGTMLAKNAGELMGEVLYILDQGLPVKTLFDRIYPYPTMSRVHRKAIQSHLGAKLTPRAVTILRNLFKILN